MEALNPFTFLVFGLALYDFETIRIPLLLHALSVVDTRDRVVFGFERHAWVPAIASVLAVFLAITSDANFEDTILNWLQLYGQSVSWRWRLLASCGVVARATLSAIALSALKNKSHAVLTSLVVFTVLSTTKTFLAIAYSLLYNTSVVAFTVMSTTKTFFLSIAYSLLYNTSVVAFTLLSTTKTFLSIAYSLLYNTATMAPYWLTELLEVLHKVLYSHHESRMNAVLKYEEMARNDTISTSMLQETGALLREAELEARWYPLMFLAMVVCILIIALLFANRVLNFGLSVLNRVLNFGLSVLNRVLNFGLSVLNCVLDFGRSVLDFGRSVLDYGQSVLDFGRSVLNFGRSVLSILRDLVIHIWDHGGGQTFRTWVEIHRNAWFWVQDLFPDARNERGGQVHQA